MVHAPRMRAGGKGDKDGKDEAKCGYHPHLIRDERDKGQKKCSHTQTHYTRDYAGERDSGMKMFSGKFESV